MMDPAALQGWAPSFGQWCSFAISGLRRGGSTYAFRGRFDPVESVAVRLELVDLLTRELGRGEDRDVVLLARAEDWGHSGAPVAVPQDVVVEDQGPDLRR